MLAQSPRHVGDVDDRLVDDGTERNREPCHDHRIERHPTLVEHQQRRHQGQRDGHQADQGDPPVVEKHAERRHHEKRSNEERRGEAIDRHLDKGRRPKDGGVDLDTGQTGLQRFELCFHVPRHVQRVGTREFLDDQQQAGAIHKDRVSDERLMVFDHLGHVRQAQSFCVCNDHLSQVIRL